MTSLNESEVLAIFEEALDQPSGTRIAWARERSKDDPALRRRLMALLEADVSSASGIRTGGAGGDAVAFDPPERIGAYKINDMIGEGGMGAVFRGSRDTGDFEHEVAIKIIRPGVLSDVLEERFRHERQILARLNHPNIARLFDGGETEAGAPFIIMEYVDGLPLLEYTAEKGLDLKARVALFRTVCLAVAHAHQNLVIHRDITPTNVLVTKDGVVKLIDFGISKADESDMVGDSISSTSTMSYTPGYAAPERQTGAPATTLTDVFSLGKLLRDLTGKEEAEPDLAAIAKMASALDPARRYPSVDALVDDIDQWREGRPVLARGGGTAYTFGKFLKRRKGIMAGAAAAFLAITGALVVTYGQWQTAEAQRKIAEERFNDVRELAGTVLFDVYDQVSRIPGSTAARLTIAEAAQSYLDELAATEGAPIDLRLETANGYTALGQIYGSPKGQSLERFEDGKAAYAKAEQIYKAVLEDYPDNPEALYAIGQHYYYEAEIAVNPDQDIPRAMELLDTSEAYLDRLIELQPDNEDARLARLYTRATRPDIYIMQNELGQAGATLEANLAAINALIDARRERGDPPREDFLRYANGAMRVLGQVYTYQGRNLAAVDILSTAIEVYPQLEELAPDDAYTIRGKAMAHWRRAFAYKQMNEFEKAVADYEVAIAAAEQLVARDPLDRGAVNLVATFKGEMTMALSGLGRYEEAEVYLLEALEYYQAQYRADPTSGARRRSIMVQNYQMATHYRAAGNAAKACEYAQNVIGFAEIMLADGQLSAADEASLPIIRGEFPDCF